MYLCVYVCVCACVYVWVRNRFKYMYKLKFYEHTEILTESILRLYLRVVVDESFYRIYFQQLADLTRDRNSKMKAVQ